MRPRRRIGRGLTGYVLYRTLKPLHCVRDKLDIFKPDRLFALLHGDCLYRTNDERTTACN